MREVIDGLFSKFNVAIVDILQVFIAHLADVCQVYHKSLQLMLLQAKFSKKNKLMVEYLFGGNVLASSMATGEHNEPTVQGLASSSLQLH